MVETLIDYKINPQIIETVSNMYTGDKTKIRMGENDELEMTVTSGIRQGCTGSITIFILTT